MTLRRAAGQVLMVGLESTQLSAVETAWLRLLRPGASFLLAGAYVCARAR